MVRELAIVFHFFWLYSIGASVLLVGQEVTGSSVGLDPRLLSVFYLVLISSLFYFVY